MSLLQDLLAKGYFPAELPPCFSSSTFPLAFHNAATIPIEFTNPCVSRGVPYSFARGGTGAIRRHLSIVNPVGYYPLAECIASNWPAIDSHLTLTQLSHSRPIHWSGSKRALSTASYAKRFLVQPKAKIRATARAILTADISQFYHSIYTHSIAWAFHTKAIAKANYSHTLFGNKLDSLVQKSQDRQTRGIPIGPDTSLVISESILARIEASLLVRMPTLRGIRFIDDYELCFSDLGSAENALSVLQEELQTFELQLNPSKTKIVQPPIRFEPMWIGEFRTFKIRSNKGQHGDLVRYFDLITSHTAGSVDDHVAKYAISKLLINKFQPALENVALYQALLCQLLMSQPSAVREIVEALISLHGVAPYFIDGSLLQATFSEVAKRAAPLGHHYELSWILYGVLRLPLILDPNAVTAIAACDNAVVALMAMNASAHGRLPQLDPAKWAMHMTQGDLYDEFWILAYEANRLQWLPSIGGSDHVSGNAPFAHLRGHGIAFFNPL